MKITVTKSMFHDEFRKMDLLENFSYEGREALYEYLEEMEDASGVEMELDTIALCCDFNEKKISDVLENYNLNSLDELRDKTLVIWNDDKTVLFQAY